MIKFVITLFSIVFVIANSSAQKGELMVKSSDKGFYLDHKVQPKESLYALGRMYNVSVKFLAAYNNLDLSKGLQIDQKIRIPLTDTNFTQTANSGAPIYYKVGDNEGLATVSKKNNGVKLVQLRLWNALTTDELKEDKKLIIGFLKGGTLPTVTIKNKSVPDEPVAAKVEKPIQEKEPVVKPEEKPIVKVIEEKPVVKVVEEKPVVKIDTRPTPDGEGYFKNDFERQVRISPVTKNETVTGGIFKTTSGWQDAKYYLLVDKVSPGTIVKIINPTNNKAVFAKVLGEMAGIRQNIGLNIRMSNAAAVALGLQDEEKFIVKINY